MGYVVDGAAKLAEAIKRNRFGSVASLRRAGTPTAQHNVKVASTKKSTAKKTAAKKTAAKKTVAKKAAPAKKSTAKKTAAKK